MNVRLIKKTNKNIKHLSSIQHHIQYTQFYIVKQLSTVLPLRCVYCPPLDLQLPPKPTSNFRGIQLKWWQEW